MHSHQVALTFCLVTLTRLVSGQEALVKAENDPLTATARLLPSPERDYIHVNKVVAKLERRRPATGIFVYALDFYNAYALLHYNGFPDAQANLERPMIDFIVIDLEHAPFEISALEQYLLALHASRQDVLARGSVQPSLAVFVRIPEEGAMPLHARIKQVLDMGAHGVVVPHVKTAEEARRIAAACRYRQPEDSPLLEPAGQRGFSPKMCHYLWGVDIGEYYRRADVWPLNPRGDIMAILMIEDPEGVENIEEIVRTPGIGGIFFGPADYTVSSGNMGRPEAGADVEQALQRVMSACNRAAVPFVGFANASNVRQKIDAGVELLLIGHDIGATVPFDATLQVLRQP